MKFLLDSRGWSWIPLLLWVSFSSSIEYSVQLEDDFFYTHASEAISLKLQDCTLILVYWLTGISSPFEDSMSSSDFVACPYMKVLWDLWYSPFFFYYLVKIWGFLFSWYTYIYKLFITVGKVYFLIFSGNFSYKARIIWWCSSGLESWYFYKDFGWTSFVFN